MKISELLMGLGIIFVVLFILFFIGLTFKTFPIYIEKNSHIIILGLFSGAVTFPLLAFINQEFKIAKEGWMIRKIGILLVGACPCVLGYYLYTGFKEPILLPIAAFLLIFGLFSMTINRKATSKNKSFCQLEMRRKIKMVLFHFLATVSLTFLAFNIGGEELGKINYYPVCCTFLFLVFFSLGLSCKKPIL